MNQVLITPALLRWARERMNYSQEVLATHLSSKAETVVEWESGLKRPTFNQAQTIAAKLRIPFGYLFLSKPPIEQIEIPDLRSVDIDQPIDFSPDFIDVYTDTLLKQEWYSEYRKEDGWDKIEFIGSATIHDNILDLATVIREQLKINRNQSKSVSGVAEYLRMLVDNSEALGINVLISGIVRNNTHRPLSVKEFRGFVLKDAYAPFVFINGKDSNTAKVFTLIHEIVHLWIGENGVVNLYMDDDLKNTNRIERYCNSVTAEILVPLSSFRENWNDSKTPEENKITLSRLYKVSPIVILRRALECRLITRNVFSLLYEQELIKDIPNKKAGGDAIKTLPVRHGRSFTYDLISAAMSGQVLFRDASRLLNLKKVVTLNSLAKEMGIK